MAKRPLLIIGVLVLVVVAAAAILFLGFPGYFESHTTPIPTPTLTPTPEASPTPTPSVTQKPTLFNHLTLDSSGFTLTGYLTEANEETNYIPNATIYVVDADNGTVYAQTITVSTGDSQHVLGVGGFSCVVPDTHDSYTVVAEFRGDSQYAECTSVVLTVNSIADRSYTQ